MRLNRQESSLKQKTKIISKKVSELITDVNNDQSSKIIEVDRNSKKIQFDYVHNVKKFREIINNSESFNFISIFSQKTLCRILMEGLDPLKLSDINQLARLVNFLQCLQIHVKI